MMNKLFIVVLVSLSTLLFACDGEGSSNSGDSAGGAPSSGGGGASAENPSEAIDARNESIQQDLSSGADSDPFFTTETEVESVTEPTELEPINNEDENSLDSADS